MFLYWSWRPLGYLLSLLGGVRCSRYMDLLQRMMMILVVHSWRNKGPLLLYMKSKLSWFCLVWAAVPWRYFGASPHLHLYTRSAILNIILSPIFSQCKTICSHWCGLICISLVIILHAIFCMHCSLSSGSLLYLPVVNYSSLVLTQVLVLLCSWYPCQYVVIFCICYGVVDTVGHKSYWCVIHFLEDSQEKVLGLLTFGTGLTTAFPTLMDISLTLANCCLVPRMINCFFIIKFE